MYAVALEFHQETWNEKRFGTENVEMMQVLICTVIDKHTHTHYVGLTGSLLVTTDNITIRRARSVLGWIKHTTSIS